jgi:hypothetical protein
MNIKSLLLASVVATVAGSAFANNYDNGELQVAQLSAPAARATTRATVAPQVVYSSRSDISPYVVSNTTDNRTRAEVRAEAVSFNKSGEARAARALYAGGAQ